MWVRLLKCNCNKIEGLKQSKNWHSECYIVCELVSYQTLPWSDHIEDASSIVPLTHWLRCMNISYLESGKKQGYFSWLTNRIAPQLIGLKSCSNLQKTQQAFESAMLKKFWGLGFFVSDIWEPLSWTKCLKRWKLKNICIACHVRLFEKIFFQWRINCHQVAITVNIWTFGKFDIALHERHIASLSWQAPLSHRYSTVMPIKYQTLPL